MCTLAKQVTILPILVYEERVVAAAADIKSFYL